MCSTGPRLRDHGAKVDIDVLDPDFFIY